MSFCSFVVAPAVRALALVVCGVGTALAAPYLPTDDTTVLERLPREIGGARAELQALRARLAAVPGNLTLALRLAERLVARGRSEADPRYYGQAEAVLWPWFATESPPPDVLVMRATLAQHRHDFAAAAADLTAALDADPTNARAWLTLATIRRVQGRYAEAGNACSRLFGLAPLEVTFACLADVGSLSGAARANHDRLQLLVRDGGGSGPEVRTWMLTVLAESAARAGETAVAEQHFRDALATSVHDPALLAAYADFLFDAQRPGDVRDLLAGEERADPLLLRLAIAERRLGDAAWMRHRQMLAERIAAGRMRGDRAHLREEARFALELGDDAKTALGLAIENWQVQREPSDARLVLDAARAAGEPVAAGRIIAWLTETGLEDPGLRRLARSFSEIPS